MKQVPDNINNSSNNLPSNLEDIEAFVERLFVQPKEVSLQDCFMAAAEAEEYLRLVRTKLAVKVTRDLPEVIDKVTEKAKKGSLEAARILLDVADTTKRTGPVVNVATQVNLSPQELQELREDVGDVVDAEVRSDDK